MIRLSKASFIWVTVIAALFGGGLVIWAMGYQTWEFKGGESMRDSGFFSYPRYHAVLGRLPLGEAGKYEFSVRGMPPDPMILALDVLDATHAEREELTSLSTLVSVTITDASGNVLCTASGHLFDAKRRDLSSWVLASSASDAYFWHPGCREFRVSPSRSYVMDLNLSDVDPLSPHKTILVILEGGGNELP